MHRLTPYVRVLLAWSCALLLLAASCSRDSGDVLTQAYVAPASVNVRSQLNQKNSTVAVVKHGDRVSVIDARRRYVKIRTAKGAEGWLDSNDLLSPSDMNQLNQERRRALALPAEGSATAYEPSNIHLYPSRKSPAFALIPEGGPVVILARKITPKLAETQHGPTFVVERPQQAARKQRKDRSVKNSFKLPPPPPPPKPPANWVAMSGGDESDNVQPANAIAKSKDGQRAPEVQKPPALESWTLIKTASNQVGWVLSHNLMMSIPDEVAQYAEGKHITSFFDLGTVEDEVKGPKHNWLWTTISGTEGFDFDSWRVFLWNRRRHRYETSYRQRDLEGYFPVAVDPADATAFGRVFKLVTKDDDGKFRRRTYLFDGVRVHLTGTEAYSPGESSGMADPAQLKMQGIQANTSQSNWLKRKWDEVKKRFSKDS